MTRRTPGEQKTESIGLSDGTQSRPRLHIVPSNNGEGVLESNFLIYDRPAGARHIRTAVVFAAILALASLAIFPYRQVPLPRISQFIPVIDTVHFLFCGIIATVLFSLASVLRSKALIALGSGYVFVALIAAGHALTYPNTFSPTGLFGAKNDTVTWLYLAWHTVLPAAIIVYARMKEGAHQAFNSAGTPKRAILIGVLIATMMAIAAIWLATAGNHREVTVRPYADGWHYLVMLLTAGTLVVLWRGRRSILDLALMLTLWAWLLEYLQTLPPGGSPRFGLGWYSGRMMGLLAGLFVLLMVLIEMTRLYARTVVLAASQNRERQNRLLLGEAVGAYITHELRQPLAAIGLNAYTAQQLSAPLSGELSAVMGDLVGDSRRANDILESTQAIFGMDPTERRPTDLNQLIRDTLLLTSDRLKSRDIRVVLKLDDHLPLVKVNIMQMQQVFLNLVINAAEALNEVTAHPRHLTIQSSSSDIGIIIRVEDNGPGIRPGDATRLFDPLFTAEEDWMGMGLSISRSVVLAHGGSIEVTPGTPSGVAFEILLPHGAGLSREMP
jgi:signal transduction histidine kinase